MLRNSFFLAVLFLTAPLFGALIIDDFSDGDLSLTLNSANSRIENLQTGLTSVIGGSRQVLSMLDSPIDPLNDATITIDSSAGTFHLSTDHELAMYRLEWGSASLPDAPGQIAVLNADLTTPNKLGYFLIKVASASMEHTVGFTLLSGVDEGGSFRSNTTFFDLPASATPYSIILDSDLFSTVDFGDIDYIGLGEGPIAPGLDFVLDEIVWVPEPCSLALLGVGGLAVIRRRK